MRPWTFSRRRTTRLSDELAGLPHVRWANGLERETSGPDGVQVVNIPGQHQVFVGDGPSILWSFNINPPTTNPTFTQLPTLKLTGGQFRVDEMSYSPTANTVLVANNADTPAFATLINAKTGALVTVPGGGTKITIPQGGTAGGLEASDFNPVTKTFFLAVPQLAAIPGAKGGVAEIDPATGAVIRVINRQPVLNLQPSGPAATVRPRASLQRQMVRC